MSSGSKFVFFIFHGIIRNSPTERVSVPGSYTTIEWYDNCPVTGCTFFIRMETLPSDELGSIGYTMTTVSPLRARTSEVSSSCRSQRAVAYTQ